MWSFYHIKGNTLLIVNQGIYYGILNYCLFRGIRPLDVVQMTRFQVTCGSELAVLFVETLVKAKIPYDDDSLGQLTPCDVIYIAY